MYKGEHQWFHEHLSEVLNGEYPRALYCVCERTEVSCGNENDCDLEYCREHGITVYMMQRCGGTIVCSAGNICVCAITPVSWGWQCDKFNEAFVEWLRSFGLNVETNNNDILIDGYKVASGAELRIGDNLERIYSSYQISINQDVEAIKHICKKEMVKRPKALNDYGFTTEQVEAWCNDYFDKLVEGE